MQQSPARFEIKKLAGRVSLLLSAGKMQVVLYIYKTQPLQEQMLH